MDVWMRPYHARPAMGRRIIIMIIIIMIIIMIMIMIMIITIIRRPILSACVRKATLCERSE